MDPERIASGNKSQVTHNESNANFSGTEHLACHNDNTLAEGGLPEKVGFKMAQDFINKI
ncbi:MAG: hypothetical protein HFH49_03740 [Lachnospiraceae bacterium]|nr:hypothetical protein [Lachnospiraceae bacterium]